MSIAPVSSGTLGGSGVVTPLGGDGGIDPPDVKKSIAPVEGAPLAMGGDGGNEPPKASPSTSLIDVRA